jgi:hypothetical protein
MTHQTCNKCKIEKPFEDFHEDSSKPQGRCYTCKPCASIRAKAHYEANRKKAKDYNLKRYYGIDLEVFEDLLSAQNGCCAICGTDAPGGKGTWHVDHCHSSGKVRGLLCHHCNVGLGHFKDSKTLLLKASLYLEDKS